MRPGIPFAHNGMVQIFGRRGGRGRVAMGRSRARCGELILSP